MKSNAQLRRDDSDDEVPPPAAMLVGFPDMASSSQTVLQSEPEFNYAQIMEALTALQGRMSNMQVSMSTMQ
jgi:TolA-binding protein